MKSLTLATTALLFALGGSITPALAQGGPTQLLTDPTHIWGYWDVVDFEEFATWEPIEAAVQVGAAVGEDIRVEGSGFLGAPEYYYLGWNGEWYSKPAAYLNSEVGSFSFVFAEAVSAVGGVVNFFGEGPEAVFIEALAADGTVLGSYAPEPYHPERMFDTGPFVGFQRTTADIAAIRFNNGYIAVDDLTFARTTVTPEPVTMVLLGSGLAGIGAAARRRRRKEEELAAP